MARKSKQEENRVDFMDYLDKQVKFKKSIGKIRTSEIYESLWKKLYNWLNGQKLYFDEITGDKMQRANFISGVALGISIAVLLYNLARLFL